MKVNKILKRIIICFILIITIFTMTCCGSDNNNQKSGNDYAKVITLSDFEQFNPDFQLLRLYNGFGRVDVNTDLNYVKSGKQSAMLRPLGMISDDAKPYLFIELESELYNYCYADIRYLYSISLWIYNDSTQKKSIELGMITDITSLQMDDSSGVKQQGNQSYSLNNGWNKLTYFIDRDVIHLSPNETKVIGLYLQFERTASRDIKDSPVFYLDDVQVTMLSAFNEIKVTEPDYSPKQGDTILIPTATIEGGSISYVVSHNNKIIITQNNSFVPNDGGEYDVIYKSNINGYIYKKTITFFVKPTNAVEIIGFKDAQDTTKYEIWGGHIESIDFMDSFKGEIGVAKVTMCRDWPYAHVYPSKTIDAYVNCNYVVIRAYFASGDNQIKWFSINEERPIGYGDRVEYDKWVSYKFPIQVFLDNFSNVFTAGNTTSYQVNGVYYLSDFYAM